jgi:hypothetical protein
MTVLTAIATGLIMGMVFGLLLEKSRVFEPGVILGQLRLSNFLMLKIFLAGVASSLVVLARAERDLGRQSRAEGDTLGCRRGRRADPRCGDRACRAPAPGTVLAQIGAGYRDAWATLAGGLLGALAFIYAEPALKPILLSGGPGKLTVHGLLGLPFWPLALGFAAALIAALSFLSA